MPDSAQSSVEEGVAITNFTLIDARDDVAIPAYDPIPEGAIINLEELEAKHHAIFETSGLPSGVYYARLVASGDIVTQQLLLTK